MDLERLELFQQYRPLLFSIAYRMLGTAMDAEDMVQETYLRWQQARAQTPADEVESPKAYLSAIVTRLCIDHLRSAQAQREAYVGPWLPEPLAAEAETETPMDNVMLAESLSTAFLVLLQSLSPQERAVFLLREVFDYDYTEVAGIVGVSEANCRQLFKRARDHVRERRPRFDAPPEQRDQLIGRFAQACASGDMNGLLALFSQDITLYADGGGRTRAALNPIHGPDHVGRYLLGVIAKARGMRDARLATINGQPGIITYIDGTPYAVTTFDIAGGRICAVYNLLNPDKLRGLPSLD